MAFMLSPGVQVTEKDLTNIIPAVSSSAGATAGVFRWGPVMDPVTVSSENELVQRFGSPNGSTAESFFTAANFLSYASNMLIARVDTAGNKNAVSLQTGSVSAITVTDDGDLYTVAPTVTISAPQVSGGVQATATATIDIGTGNVTGITITNPGSGYSSASVTFTGGTTGTNATGTTTIALGGVKINNQVVYEDSYEGGQGVVGEFAARYPGKLGNSIRVGMVDAAVWTQWPASWKEEFDGIPGTNELHVIVVDVDGKISGTAGTVLEKFNSLSKSAAGRREDGTNIYYKNVLNASSKWIYWMDHPAGSTGWGTDEGPYSAMAADIEVTLSGGVDDFTATDGNKMNAFALFADATKYDISLIPVGKASTTVATYVIGSVAEAPQRKDCLVFVSPENANGTVIKGSDSTLADAIVTYRNGLPSTSYGVMDSGYKYQYDRYNDVYRWIPLNGDVAGICARTDFTDDPWFSPGGYTRGQVKNVTKLAYNPDQSARDKLYKAGVNPVVSFPGQGTVLYGDKTLYSKPSAFDRINVRRLFIVLEKAVSTAAKFQLFEFNDQFTRAQFLGIVEPFLRDVQGRRGIYDFRVVCDETNNTGEVIDANRFVADIYIKPARAINFISLNFIAARTSVSFEEVGG